MQSSAEPTSNTASDGPASPFDPAVVWETLAVVPQIILGLLPRTAPRCLIGLMGRATDDAQGARVLRLSALGAVLGVLVTLGVFMAMILLLAAWAHVFPSIVSGLVRIRLIDPDSGWTNKIPSSSQDQMMYAWLLTYASGLFVRTPYESFGRPFKQLRGVLWLRETIARITALLGLLGFGLLPLASLLMFLPIVMPQEAVLSDTISPARTRWKKFGRRAFAVLAGVSLLISLLTVSTQIIGWIGLKSSIFSGMTRTILGESVSNRLPAALVDGWPFVMLLVYVLDFALLFFIGKVPLSYNLRNLRVRWVTTMMTCIAFTVVVFLLILMSSFVDSVNRLTANSGVPGNVFVMSEGSTDELFSNLGYGDVGKLELETATTDAAGRNLKSPIFVKSTPGRGGQPPLRWCSKETYFVINQEIAKPTGGGPARRFVQLRGIEDGEVAGKVHDITLEKGEWFGREGAVSVGSGATAVPCVLGQGASAAFGADYGRARLDVGDVFKIGDLDMVVVGIMKSAGRTFDSETWATSARVGKAFGKQSYTTVVLRVSDENPETMNRSAEIFAAHLTKNFTTPRLRAVSETRYYEDLAKSNSQLMFMVTIVAIIMALGGTIGVMLVMFAAIAQRIKDIGVMRVVGYKRWQILVSFMLESLAIAIIGGLIGVMLILLVDGIFTVIQGGIAITSTVSSGQGGGKTVVTKLSFGLDTFAAGMLFSLVMGRLGGLLPSVSAMRLGILESLR